MSKQKFKKAYIVIPYYSDRQDPEILKMTDGYPTYAETAGKAKYDFACHIEYEDLDWWKFRALRWREKDLFPPVLHESLELLTKEQISKMKHTYGTETDYPGNRNYYHCEWDDEDFRKLMKLNMAERNCNHDKILREGSTYFYLTDFGIEVIMSTRERLRESINNG